MLCLGTTGTDMVLAAPDDIPELLGFATAAEVLGLTTAAGAPILSPWAPGIGVLLGFTTAVDVVCGTAEVLLEATVIAVASVGATVVVSVKALALD